MPGKDILTETNNLVHDQDHNRQCTVESFSWGVPGLDLKLIVSVNPEAGIILSPTDPWFTFAPHVLSRLATDCVRRFNLSPSLQWFAWMPDNPDCVYTWRPAWDKVQKKYKPIEAHSGMHKVPSRNIPEWVSKVLPGIKKQHELSIRECLKDNHERDMWIKLVRKQKSA